MSYFKLNIKIIAFDVQKLGGKCGVCGDPYDAPIKAHELGGTYATGKIVRSYKMGQTIPITITVSFYLLD